MSDIKLTIGIPTFNRNETLIESLRFLVPQIHRNINVELLIVDNSSDVPVQESILKNYPELFGKVRFIRNKFNVGANENVLRVIENASGSYVYVLGDDDHVLPDAVDKILDSIDKHPNAWFINFNTPLPGHQIRSSETSHNSLLEFIDSIDSFGQIMFISDGVFNVSSLRKGFRFGCFFQNTCAPIFVALLYSMMLNNNQGKVVLSNTRIIDVTTTAPLDTQLSILPVVNGLSFLADLDLPYDISRSLKRAISTTQKGWLTYRGFVRGLVYDLHNGRSRFETFSKHNTLVRSFYFLDRNFFLLTLRYCFSVIFFSKTVTRLLLKMAEKMTGRSFLLEQDKRSSC